MEPKSWLGSCGERYWLPLSYNTTVHLCRCVIHKITWDWRRRTRKTVISVVPSWTKGFVLVSISNILPDLMFAEPRIFILLRVEIQRWWEPTKKDQMMTSQASSVNARNTATMKHNKRDLAAHAKTYFSPRRKRKSTDIFLLLACADARVYLSAFFRCCDVRRRVGIDWKTPRTKKKLFLYTKSTWAFKNMNNKNSKPFFFLFFTKTIKRNPFSTSRYFNITQGKKNQAWILQQKREDLRNEKGKKACTSPLLLSTVKKKEITFPLQSDLLVWISRVNQAWPIYN